MKYRFVRRIREKHYYIADDNDIWDNYKDIGDEIIAEYELTIPVSVGDQFAIKELNDIFKIQRIVKSPDDVILCYIRDNIINIDEATKELKELHLILEERLENNSKLNKKTNLFSDILHILFHRK